MALPNSSVQTVHERQIRVVVVDDSPAMRLLLQQIINKHDDMHVVGSAPDSLVARDMIKELEPDLITLDIEMPGMNGLDFLERIMRLRPMPVLMISSRTAEGSEHSLRALELGAVDIIQKRALTDKAAMIGMAEEVAEKIRAAYKAVAHFQGRQPLKVVNKPGLVHVDSKFDPRKLLFVGASTGGTEAIKALLDVLPPHCPPVLIAQHMPEDFTARFAKRLNDTCTIRVKEAVHGERIQAGCAYIAPGHSHLLVRRITGGGYETQLSDAPEVNRHRPSVDVLFDSAADQVGKLCSGVLLTGMGKDGAAGLLRMRQTGALTYTQSEASCVVWGMPRAAYQMGASCGEGTPAELAELALNSLRI